MRWIRTLVTRLLGSPQERASEALWATIQCDRCQELITVRIDKRTDLQSEYQEAGDIGPWYRLDKEVMGNKCFALMHLSLEFDQHRNVIHQQVTGGKLLRLESTRLEEV